MFKSLGPIVKLIKVIDFNIRICKRPGMFSNYGENSSNYMISAIKIAGPYTGSAAGGW